MAAGESGGQYPSNWLKYSKFPTNLVWLPARKNRAVARLFHYQIARGRRWAARRTRGSGRLVLGSALTDQFEHTLTGVFEIVENLAEAVGAAVVRIGHGGFFELVGKAHQ